MLALFVLSCTCSVGVGEADFVWLLDEEAMMPDTKSSVRRLIAQDTRISPTWSAGCTSKRGFRLRPLASDATSRCSHSSSEVSDAIGDGESCSSLRIS